MSWRLARSLSVLRLEANTVAPNRSRAADGTIGDAAHASRASRHNPNDAGVVCALDLTHDPEHGMDTYSLFEWLCLHPHPNLEYAISNRRIAHRNTAFEVRTYQGTMPHDHHIHIGVGVGPDREPRPPYDDQDSWRLSEWKGYVPPVPEPEEEDLTPEEHEDLVQLRHTVAVKQSYVNAITNALVVENWPEAERLNDAFYEKWPYPESTTGLEPGWRHG